MSLRLRALAGPSPLQSPGFPFLREHLTTKQRPPAAICSDEPSAQTLRDRCARCREGVYTIVVSSSSSRSIPRHR
jgi:hypothetical protein